VGFQVLLFTALDVARLDHAQGNLSCLEMTEIFGSPGRIRTSDQPVNSRLLYH
jgi:hypothetical protein